MFSFLDKSGQANRESHIITSFMYKVYAWMCTGLLVTALCAYAVAAVPAARAFVFGNQWVFFGLIIAQLIVVIGLTSAMNRLSFQAAFAGFCTYAALVGVTLSSILVVYKYYSIYSTFIVTAGMFAGMACYGYYTRSDLTGIGSFAMMLLWGIILGLVVNIFLGNAWLDMVLSGVGVLVFTLLTAFDVQKIKALAYQVRPETDVFNKVALLGALTLYLDFINLFLFLLRFTGRQRD